jgi:hypothetical protein
MMASILDELPKDFLFHAEGVMPIDGERIHSRRAARPHAGEHGYEGMRKLFRLLIDQRTFIRVISSILARIIEGLMAGVLQIGLQKSTLKCITRRT